MICLIFGAAVPFWSKMENVLKVNYFLEIALCGNALRLRLVEK
jgi:hypothetical protein